MKYVKFLDPYIHTSKFINSASVSDLKPRFIEAVGFFVDENDESVFIANSMVQSIIKAGDTFKTEPAFNRVMCIPINALVEQEDVEPSDQIREVSYIDIQSTAVGQYSVEKVRKLPKPPVINVCGFVAKEDEETISLAMERNSDGLFRTINVIPKKFIVKV